MPLLPFPPYAPTLQTSKQPPKAPRRQAAARMWSAAPNASPLVPGRGMPQATTQMLQSQQLHAQLLQRHMTQPQVVHPQQLHLQLPQLSQRQMTQLHISQPQGCHSQWPQTQMLQSHAQTLQCQLQMLQSQTQTPQAYAQMLQSQTQTPQTYAQMLQSQTQTPQTYAQMLQSQTQTPQTCAQMLQSQTQTPQTYAQMLQSQTQTPQIYAQMLQSHMHDIEQTHESCRTLPNMTLTGGQVVPSQRLQQLLALMSVPDQGQGQYELAPYASASQGPFVADQSGTGFLYTSSHPPQLVTTHPHVDAAGQLQCQAFAQPPTLILDQHESACQPAYPPQQSKTVDSHFLQELFATADQQLMMLCQLSAPIQSADDLLTRLNSMGSDGINAEQVAESKDVGSGSSACQGHVDSHSAPSEAQMVQLLQSSAKDIAELLQTLSAPENVCQKQDLARAASLLMAQPVQPCLP